MDRKRFLARRKLRYIVFFMVIFMAVFAIFSFIVYQSSSAALFEDIDSEYRFAGGYIQDSDERSLENYLAGRNIVYSGDGSYVVNHKIFLLMRDADGTLLNWEALSDFDYILNVRFDGQDVERARTERVTRHGESVYYRTYSVPVQGPDGEGYHIQMTTNVTDIMKSLGTIGSVLVRGAVLFFLVSLVTSWFLGQFLINSVSKTWEQQDEFLSYSAHLIRAPLTVIHSSLEMVLQKPSARVMDVSDHLLHAVSESSRLRKTSTRMMSMAVLQAPEFILRREPFRPNEQVMGFIEAFEAQALDTERAFALELEEGIEISGDPELLNEMCILLLENALKYTWPGDSIRFSLWQEAGQMYIEVADTGIGISDEALPKIFTRFYREESVKNAQEGSGLGLYIASLIAHQHGGSIKASHNQPKGTVFRVRIPLKKRRGLPTGE